MDGGGRNEKQVKSSSSIQFWSRFIFVNEGGWI